MTDILKNVNNENDLKIVKTLFDEMLNYIGITYEEFKEMKIDDKDLTSIVGKHSVI